MSNFHQYHFSDFTTSHYRELLRLAKAKYFFRTFTEPLTGDPTVI